MCGKGRLSKKMEVWADCINAIREYEMKKLIECR